MRSTCTSSASFCGLSVLKYDCVDWSFCILLFRLPLAFFYIYLQVGGWFVCVAEHRSMNKRTQLVFFIHGKWKEIYQPGFATHSAKGEPRSALQWMNSLVLGGKGNYCSTLEGVYVDQQWLYSLYVNFLYIYREYTSVRRHGVTSSLREWKWFNGREYQRGKHNTRLLGVGVQMFL